MEPVPETERMEEFRSSRLPTSRLSDSPQYDGSNPDFRYLKPPTIRRSTDPTPSSPQSPVWASATLAHRPRNTSPYSRGHTRSRSTASALAPPMSRAHSLPGLNTAGHLHPFTQNRSSSPAGSPNRNRIPRKLVDDAFPRFPMHTRGDMSEIPISISEDEELPRGLERSYSPTSGMVQGNTLPRNWRPSSPLRNLSVPNSTSSGIASAYLASNASSPSYQNIRFTDSFSGTYLSSGPYTSSSVPSTPTSIRSRSPSISSLETIPDSPDAEEAALEAERIAQLKAAADAADGDEAVLEAKRQLSLETAIGRGRTLGPSFGSRDKRKRWSVCGAERRGDLDLETIWED